MSAERARGERSVPSKYEKRIKVATEIAAAGAALGFLGVMGITIEHHRRLTHRSVEPHPLLTALINAEQRSLGVGDTTIWASVHRIHHSMTDASLFPFYQIAGAIEWASRRENRGKVEIPETYAHLDPFVDKFSRKDVTKIGKLAKEHVKERLGDKYVEKTNYTADEVREMLNPTGPRFVYPEYMKHEGEWTQDDLAQILLTDPHSPALTGGDNGVQKIALKNIGLYQHTAQVFREQPDLKPKDLQNDDGKNRESRPIDVAAGFVLPSAAVLFKRGKYKPKDFAIAAAAGSAINGVRVATELFGGNITNSMGHAGVFDQSRLFQALFKRTYEIQLNPDGSLTTDTVHSGIAGKLLSWLTFDEVGGQDVHHKYPEKIAYTLKEGIKAIYEAPWGSFLSYVAHSRIPILEPGKGFGDLPRPDVPHEGVLLIQKARADQMALAA